MKNSVMFFLGGIIITSSILSCGDVSSSQKNIENESITKGRYTYCLIDYYRPSKGWAFNNATRCNHGVAEICNGPRGKWDLWSVYTGRPNPCR